MAGTVNPQFPMPTPSNPDGPSIIRTFIGWAQTIVNQLFTFGQRINLCLPKDGTEAMTGTLNGTSAVFSGTVTATGNPKARAHQTAVQSIPNSAFTKLTLDTEDFDTNNNFASSRFTPTVAGYYEVTAQTHFNPITAEISIAIVKNGTFGAQNTTGAGASQQGIGISDIVFCNGTTDFIEIFVFQTSGAAATTNTSQIYLNYASFARLP